MLVWILIVVLCVGIALVVYSYHPSRHLPPQPRDYSGLPFDVDKLTHRIDDMVSDLFVDRGDLPLPTRWFNVKHAELHQRLNERETEVLVGEFRTAETTVRAWMGARQLKELIAAQTQKALLEEMGHDLAFFEKFDSMVDRLSDESEEIREIKKTVDVLRKRMEQEGVKREDELNRIRYEADKATEEARKVEAEWEARVIDDDEEEAK